MKEHFEITKEPTKKRATVYLKPANHAALRLVSVRKDVPMGAILDKLIEERLR